MRQLELAIEAVFKSWNSRQGHQATAASRASPASRARRSTCSRWSSATWVTTPARASRFTRNPSTGENKFYGEFLVNAQGEDVVAGIRTPQPVDKEMPKWKAPNDKTIGKKVHAELMEIKRSSRSTTGTCRTSSSPSRRASCTCCRPGPASGPGGGGARPRCDMVKEKLINEEDGRRCGSRRATSPAAAAQIRPAAKKKESSLTVGLPPRPAPRSAHWPSPPTRRSSAPKRARRCCWSARRPARKTSTACTRRPTGHPHQHRRHDQPRGRRRPRLGQVLRRAGAGADAHRREGPQDQGRHGKTPSPHNDVLSIDGSTGEVFAGIGPDAIAAQARSGDFARS